MDRLREFRRGLAATVPYLLSHHAPEHRGRCYAVGRVHLCARCSGVYPGIAFGIWFTAGGAWPRWLPLLALVALLPAPALLDWVRSALFDQPGSNAVRTLTGIGLGVAYGTGLVWLLTGRNPAHLLAVGVVYGALALVGLGRGGVGS